MSRSKKHRGAGDSGSTRIRPLVRYAGAAARRQSGRARAWAAPQLEHAGQALQDKVAPKAAALLSAAARRVEPATPQRSRWRKLVGASAVTATASALAAAARRRAKGPTTASDPDDATNASDQEDATNDAQVPTTGTERLETSSDV
jgi:hypothetical protein